MTKRFVRSRQILSVALILLSTSPFLARAERYCCEGDSWLRWDSERRETYVRGYVDGYYGGYVHGCQEGTKHPAGGVEPGFENFPINKCLDQKWDYTKGIDLARDVTAFYRRHPENRNLLIKEILEALGKGRSIEDIHHNPPFPEHNSPRPPEATNRRVSHP